MSDRNWMMNVLLLLRQFDLQLPNVYFLVLVATNAMQLCNVSCSLGTRRAEVYQ